MQQMVVRCQSKNITWNRSMACRDTHYRPAQPIQGARRRKEVNVKKEGIRKRMRKIQRRRSEESPGKK